MIKAGGAGSIPDSSTNASWKTQPISIFLRDIGEAVSCLNTVVVGLDAVEVGHQKPASLDISWAPDDRRAAARKARKFAVESVLVRVCESFFSYCSMIASLPRFETIRASWTGDTKRSSKIENTLDSLIQTKYLLSAAILTCHWRNKIVHPTSRARLSSAHKHVLREAETEIAEAYKGLSVDRLLCHFEEGRPTLKDVTVLIAMTINLARRVNDNLVSNIDKADFDAWISYLGIDKDIEKVKSETKPDMLSKSLTKLFQSKAPGMAKAYEEFYLK